MGRFIHRFALWIVLAALLAAVLAYAFRPRPVEVELATIATGRLLVTIDEEGETRVREIYTLSAPMGGRLLRIAAQAGDRVTAGLTEIARIEPAQPALLDVRTQSELEAGLEAARAAHTLAGADLERARAELTFAESEFARARALIVDGTIPQRSLDAAERAQRVAAANVATAQATLDVRRHEMALAQAQTMGRTTIDALSDACTCVTLRAPVDGEVLRVMEKSETVVVPGQALVDIGDPRELEVVVDLLSQDAVRVTAGQEAVIADWGGQPLAAVVRRVEPFGYTRVSALGIEEQRVDVRLDVVDAPELWARVGHGYRVEVAIVTTDREVLKAPLGALFRNGGGWAVFIARNGRALLREVAIGERNAESAELLSGLAEGDQVILYPGDAIADGVRIAAREP